LIAFDIPRITVDVGLLKFELGEEEGNVNTTVLMSTLSET